MSKIGLATLQVGQNTEVSFLFIPLIHLITLNSISSGDLE